MAIIFTTIDDIKTYVGGGANTSMAIESLTATIDMVAEEHLMIWVGRPLYDDIVTAYNGNPSAEQTALIPYIQRTLALLSLYEYAKIGNIQFSEEGLHRIESENQKSAYKYQENEYKKYMLENGYAALELLLQFLEDNEADYPLWRNHATAYARNKALFINTAATFRDNYSKSISRYTFEMLRSIQEDVEIFAIKPLLGDDQHEDLKDAIVAKTYTALQTTLINKIQKAVAHFTIEEALRQNWVMVDGNKIISKEKLDSQSYEKESAPTREKMSLAVNRADEWGNRHINIIKRYLTANIDDYPLYKAYIATKEAAASTTTLSGEDCCSRTGIDCYKTTTNSRKGVRRL